MQIHDPELEEYLEPEALQHWRLVRPIIEASNIARACVGQYSDDFKIGFQMIRHDGERTKPYELEVANFLGMSGAELLIELERYSKTVK